jgi:hypothetical protein
LGFWYPHANFDIGDPIQDTNGNIEAVSAILIPNGSVESPNTYSELALAGGIGAWGTGAIIPGSAESQTLVTIGHTKYLFFSDFNLNVPTGANILGISVSIPKKVSGGTAVDQSVKLVVGGAVVGTEHASATPWSTAGFATTAYGGPVDTWSASLTAVQASTQGLSGFGVAIAADVTSVVNFQLVQSGTANTENNPTAYYTFSNPVTAGNTLVVGVHTFDEVITSITDSRGNTYTQVASVFDGLHAHYIYVVAAPAAGSTTITVAVHQLHSNSFTSINAHEFSGIITASPVEVTGTADGLATPFNSGNVTIANATDIIFSYVYADATGTATPPATYTAATNQVFSAAGGTQQLAAAFKAPGAIGSYNPQWSTGIMGITVALKSASSATVTVGGGAPNAPVITIFYQLPAGVGPGFTDTTEPIWATTLGGTVNDGGLAWTNYGPVEPWLPLTNYPVPVVVLDLNGNIQLAVATTNPVAAWLVGTAYTVGTIVSSGGSYWICVTANTGNVPNPYGGASGTIPYWALAQNPVATGTIAPVWNTTLGGTTVDGNYTWTNLGQGSPLANFGYAYVYGYRTVYGHLTTCSAFSNNTGAILGPLNGSIASFAIATGTVTFQGSNNFQPGNVFTVLNLTTGTYLNEKIFTVVTAIPSAIFPLTATKVTGGNLVTIYAINRLIAGQTVTFSNVVDPSATWLNGLTLTVLAGGLTGIQFTATVSQTNYAQTATTGSVLINGSWTATSPAGAPAAVTSTADAGTAAPLISTISGMGTAHLDAHGFALCNSIANITAYSITADIITVYASNNFQPGLFITFSGMTAATFLEGQQLQVISVDQPVGTQNNSFQVYFITPDTVQTVETGIATFNAIEIYRLSDGGGTYLFAGALTNTYNPTTGLPTPWTFDDFVIDANLDILLIAPLFHQNDPPLGAPGSIIKPVGTVTRYWQGRNWMIVGNYVYFDAGPDCSNGISEESWPPGNRFRFAGPAMNIVPTPDGVGMLVYLADRVDVILGGPETISFYATDAMGNFGIANPNAIFRDGSVIGQYTTQRQYFDIANQEKLERGKNIADYLTTNFASASTYLTMHRDGLDVGTFLSNGVDQVLRYGSNIDAWSVPAYPSFGAGALRSIETSVGVYSLMLAAPAGGAQNYLYARDINSWGDGGGYGLNNGTAYALCNIILGSITLSQPGARLFPLQHVVLYADAAGTLDHGGPSIPDVWILPNEVNATAGIGFIQLPEVLQEPPVGQTHPSKTLLSLRYPVNMMNSALASQYLHHLQVKIQWEPENAPNTLKAISFMEMQDT